MPRRLTTQRLASPTAAGEPLPGARSSTARIAHRFAPSAQSAAAPGQDKADDDAPLARALTGFVVWPRTLIASLILLALLPNLTVLAFMWTPAFRSYWSPPPPAVKSADPLSTPAVDHVKPKPLPKIHPVLTAPAMLEATANEDVPFPLALDGTDGVPPRSSIAISGLPAGAVLSNGRPYGETGWNLKSEEIGDLHLVLRNSAAGETRLRLQLIAPDGVVLADAETMLKVAIDPESASPPPAPESEPEAELAETEANGAPQELATLEADAKPDSAAAAHAGNEDRGPSASSAPMLTGTAADNAAHDGASWIEASAFVNLREGPSSSAPVIGVVAEGTKLKVIGHKRRWVRVTDPATSATGWIYGRYADGPGSSGRGPKRARGEDLSGSDESVWRRLRNWLTGS